MVLHDWTHLSHTENLVIFRFNRLLSYHLVNYCDRYRYHHQQNKDSHKF